MSIIPVDTRDAASQFEMQIGEAAMYLEKRRYWEGSLHQLVVCDQKLQAR